MWPIVFLKEIYIYIYIYSLLTNDQYLHSYIQGILTVNTTKEKTR